MPKTLVRMKVAEKKEEIKYVKENLNKFIMTW